MTDEQDPRLRARGDHPVGRPRLGDRGRHRRARPTSSSSSACRCSASAMASRRCARSSAAGSRSRDHQEFGRAFIDIVDECRAVRRALAERRARAGVDEPRRQGRGAARRLPRRRRRAKARPSPRSPTTSAASTACCSTPRSCTRRRARQLLRNFTHRVARLPRRLDDGGVPRPGDRAHPRAGRQGPRGLRPLGRRRFRGRRGAAARGDRRPADLHLRRYRPAARAARRRRS